MRKDKLSSFQAKKQKLLKIKRILENTICIYELSGKESNKLRNAIWEIVKDE